MHQKLSAYIRLIRLDKPIGSLLLLWPTLWALWVAAQGIPPIKLLLIFTLGTFLMRSAGCAINDFADHAFDGKVTRTRQRPLVAGEVSRKEAFVVFLVLSFLAFLLVLMTNRRVLFLSFVAVIVAFIYPFMKRVTHLPQLVLSIAFALGIPMAFAAQTNTVPLIAWLLFLADVLWIMAYDTFYAMTDRPDDLKIGVKSTAILFGKQDRLLTGVLQLATFFLLMWIGVWLNFKAIDYGGIMVAGVLFVYQQYLIRNRDPQACFKAFLNNQWVGFFVFLSFLIHFEFSFY